MTAPEFTFVPTEEAATRPHVVVDGSASQLTRLTLSHWPGSPVVPPDLRDDLSAQMAFRYLDRLERGEPLHGDADSVTNNHFDQDGLVGVYALVSPEEATARRELLEDVAAAGDFGTYRHRTAARVSMAIGALADPDRSPVDALPDAHGERVAALYDVGLGRLGGLVDGIEDHRSLWAEEDAVLTECEEALAAGRITIDEDAALDMAVVRAPAEPSWWGHRFVGRRYEGVHPMAIHNATPRNLVVLAAGDAVRITYRYESWVTFRSRPVRGRIDLAPVAEELSSLDDGRWAADPVGVLTPELAPAAGRTALDADEVVTVLRRHLVHDRVALDPYVPSGGR